MPIETGTTIAELDEQWPLSGDAILEGDNHIRLVKAVLKAQFPGALGDGFDTPITATEAEINYLTGLTGNVQQQIDDLIDEYQSNLYAPAGTVMVFYQAAPPTGWTQLAANDNSMLRVVAGAGGGAGGDSDPISFDFDHDHSTANHTLTVSQIPSHSHDYDFTDELGNKGKWRPEVEGSPHGGRGFQGSGLSFATLSIKNTGGGSPHNHGNTGKTNKIFTPRYISVITAVKD